MVDINLLPWREKTARYQRKITQAILIMPALAALCLYLLIHHVFNNRIADLQISIVHLKQQIAEAELYARTLKTSDEKPIFFDESAKRILLALSQKPLDICFTDIKKLQNGVSFHGEAYPASAFAQFLLHEKMASLFSDIKIEQLATKQNGIQFAFRGEV